MVDLGYKPVGQDFPVFIHRDSGEEYALARTERKSGNGYKGFKFYAATDITLEQDLIRRDLTINAMAQDSQGNITDPFGGQRDLQLKLLRHVSNAFVEDPLRVLRVARFAARYHHLGFKVAPETMTLMKSIVENNDLAYLIAERIWKETDRALGEQSPHIFIEILRDCNALAVLFPEVEALFGVPQRADYHPEIDTGIHTLMSLQQSAHLSEKGAVRFSVLMHDLGKAVTPSHVLPSHNGHEARGLPLVKAVCDRLKVPKQYRQLAMVVTEFHLHCHRALQLKPTTILDLFNSIGALKSPQILDDFLLCCEADARGRKGFERQSYPSSDYLKQALQAIAKIDVSDLVAKSMSGVEIGRRLKQRQIDRLTEYKQCYSH
jgi:tRNA nucleotidyltransferase (CCA-adding enzyme)